MGTSEVKPIPPQNWRRASVSSRPSLPAFNFAIDAIFVISSPLIKFAVHLMRSKKCNIWTSAISTSMQSECQCSDDRDTSHLNLPVHERSERLDLRRQLGESEVDGLIVKDGLTESNSLLRVIGGGLDQVVERLQNARRREKTFLLKLQHLHMMEGEKSSITWWKSNRKMKKNIGMIKRMANYMAYLVCEPETRLANDIFLRNSNVFKKDLRRVRTSHAQLVDLKERIGRKWGETLRPNLRNTSSDHIDFSHRFFPSSLKSTYRACDVNSLRLHRQTDERFVLMSRSFARVGEKAHPICVEICGQTNGNLTRVITAYQREIKITGMKITGMRIFGMRIFWMKIIGMKIIGMKTSWNFSYQLACH